MNATEAHAALVVATYSRRMRLVLDDGSFADAKIKGKKLRPVCGDQVIAEPMDGETEWLITGIKERGNELTRPDNRGRREVLAANLDCVVVMAAAEPSPDWYIVDRYLAAAENMRIDALIAFNKVDLPEGKGGSQPVLAEYRSAGYAVIPCSAETGDGLDGLQQALTERTAIIVGQSGVGKSSVINRIVHDAGQKVGTLSSASREGRHTTVNSIMLDLPNGGRVIDSPGVRDYAPAIEKEEDVIVGFREIAHAGKDCRFANCRHLREPDCAVKAAVDAGDISARRYESYKRLMVLTRGFAERRR